MGLGVRKQITLKEIANVQAATGEWEQQPVSLFNTWAEISSHSDFRDYQNGQTQLGQTKTFLVRFNFDIVPGTEWRVTYLGKDYTISKIERVQEKKFYWTITGTAK